MLITDQLVQIDTQVNQVDRNMPYQPILNATRALHIRHSNCNREYQKGNWVGGFENKQKNGFESDVLKMTSPCSACKLHTGK